MKDLFIKLPGTCRRFIGHLFITQHFAQKHENAAAAGRWYPGAGPIPRPAGTGPYRDASNQLLTNSHQAVPQFLSGRSSRPELCVVATHPGNEQAREGPCWYATPEVALAQHVVTVSDSDWNFFRLIFASNPGNKMTGLGSCRARSSRTAVDFGSHFLNAEAKVSNIIRVRRDARPKRGTQN
jgi:hypothetical protein